MAELSAETAAPGSSPRVRGTLPLPLASRSGIRFIPARAGNARSDPRRHPSLSVHPRACGERLREGDLDCPRLGSSPRVRGTLDRETGDIATERFIPARAGNAPMRSLSYPTRAVHPRACGERNDKRELTVLPNGSSPRVRGTLEPLHWPAPAQRFIPARAGNALRVAGMAC